MAYLGLGKSISLMQETYSNYHEDSRDQLNRIKRQALASIEWAERLLVIDEQQKDH